METMLGFAGVLTITVLALFIALALQNALLRATLLLMQPATVDRRSERLTISNGTKLVARAFEGHR